MAHLTEYGKFIRKIRIDRDINQTEHAELLGVSSTFLSCIEKGKKPISMDIINKTIQALKINAKEEALMIKAISQSPLHSIKITTKNSDESLLAIMLARSFANKDFDREKLKEFLKAS